MRMQNEFIQKVGKQMLANFHTHTTFCDGKNTPEEMVLAAIEKGFQSIGFSGHVTTPYDLSYCMQDMEGYKAEIQRLKKQYQKEIQVYMGIEEDLYTLVNREEYDYLIGAMHYAKKGESYYSIDSGTEYIKECVELWDNNPMVFAEYYFRTYCDYILRRKPDIVGHFDLLTKYDEIIEPIFLDQEEYYEIAEKYLEKALESDCIFEINTGAMAKGYRKSPYPCERLLHVMKKHDTKIILSSDSHSVTTIDYKFDEMKCLLKDIGFREYYVIYNKEFCKILI